MRLALVNLEVHSLEVQLLAALAVLDIIEEENLVNRAAEIGARMMTVFNSWKENMN